MYSRRYRAWAACSPAIETAQTWVLAPSQVTSSLILSKSLASLGLSFPLYNIGIIIVIVPTSYNCYKWRMCTTVLGAQWRDLYLLAILIFFLDNIFVKVIRHNNLSFQITFKIFLYVSVVRYNSTSISTTKWSPKSLVAITIHLTPWLLVTADRFSTYEFVFVLFCLFICF